MSRGTSSAYSRGLERPKFKMDAVYSHPLVQSYLSSYTPDLHDRVIRATFLYGLMALKLNQTYALPIEVLEEQIRQTSNAVGVKDLVSSYKKQLEIMKAEIEKLDGQLDAADQSPRRVKSASPKKLTLATSNDWRKGDQAVFRGPEPGATQKRSVLFRDQSPPAFRDANYNVVMKARDEFGPEPPKDYQDKIYPDWWKDLCAVHSKPSPVKAKSSRVIEPKVTRPERPASTRNSKTGFASNRSSKEGPPRQTKDGDGESKGFASKEVHSREVHSPKPVSRGLYTKEAQPRAAPTKEQHYEREVPTKDLHQREGPSRDQHMRRVDNQEQQYIRDTRSRDVYQREAPSREIYTRDTPSREQYSVEAPPHDYSIRGTSHTSEPRLRPTFSRRDIAVEADFSSESSSVEATPPARSIPSRKKDSQPWAMDYTNFIKTSPPARDSHESSVHSQEEEPRSSSQVSSKYKQSVYSQSSEDLLRSQSARSTPYEPRLASSSQYSGSSMSAYHPSEEVKTFYRNEFPNLLDSNGTQSGGSLGASWRKPPTEHSFSLKV